MARQLFELDRTRPQVMAVMNVTPDSFSDGGQLFTNGRLDKGLCRGRVESMLAGGATIIDVGGESTRPGALPVSCDEEMQRVLPVVELLAGYDVVISVDSSKPGVMAEAARLGAGLLNDVRALQQQDALDVAARSGVPVCLMHMQGEPGTMQQNPVYGNVVDEVKDFLSSRVQACLAAGMVPGHILIDPGFGFGKTVAHNVQLLAGLPALSAMGFPLLVGLSRKSMVSHLLGGREVGQRLPGSLALAVMAVERGAWIVRAHDIRETVDAVTVAYEIMREKHG